MACRAACCRSRRAVEQECSFPSRDESLPFTVFSDDNGGGFIG
jgi:hypothetical protein